MLKKKIQQYQELIEVELRAQLQLGAADLFQAVEYGLFSGGKRLRPLLSLLLQEELGGSPEKFIAASVSLEYVHCSSLIHDDLPALDDDDMRRGKLTCHKACGEGTALLAGDVLIPMAVNAICRTPFDAEIRLRMIDEVMTAYRELCEGQQLDIADGETRSTMAEIAVKKTGALFGAAMSIAAIASFSSAEVIVLARQAGRQLGICFQLLDDYIDAYGTDADRGREGSSDGKKGKRTFFSGRPIEQGRAEWELAQKRLQDDLESLEMKIPGSLALTRMFISQLLSRVEVK